MLAWYRLTQTKTCASEGLTCGSVTDECGVTTNCGGCKEPETCMDGACLCKAVSEDRGGAGVDFGGYGVEDLRGPRQANSCASEGD
jgi:hypothetical protein